MPKIDVTQIINGLDDSPLMAQSADVELCDECKAKIEAAQSAFTLRMSCTRSLTTPTEKTRSLDGAAKFARGQLAHRIYNEDDPTLTAEEIVLLKECIGDVELNPIVVMRAYELLDPQN